MDTNNSESNSKNWLITGGCGFIGTSLIVHLLQKNQGTKIRVLDNLSVGTREDLAEVSRFVEVDSQHDRTTDPRYSSVELKVGDIRETETCLGACEGIDVVVHLAANTGVAPSVENPRADMTSNVIGVFNMLEASCLNGVKKFVFASSGAPIGEVEPPITEDKPARPVSPYGASKLAGEGYCSAYYRTFGLRTVSLRFGNVYGPRSRHKSSVVAKFFKQALAGETLEIFGDGTQTRDFIYIDDLVQAISLAVEPRPLSDDVREPWGEVFQIATHRETMVNEIAEKISGLVETKTGKSVVVLHGSTRLGDVKRNYSDITKARNFLGYEPAFDLNKGLESTLNYFLNEKR